jgi:hypothetical protein
MSADVFARLAGGGGADRVVPVARSVFMAAPAVDGGGAAPAPPRAPAHDADGEATFAAWGAGLPLLLPGAWKDHDEAPLVAVLRGTGFIPRALPVAAAEPPPASAPASPVPAARVRR